MNGSSGKICDNNSNSSNNNKIYLNLIDSFVCQNCYSFILIRISEYKTGDEIFLDLVCENNHIEKCLLQNFLKNYQNYIIKNCQICQIPLYINNLLYCFPCNKIFCGKCKGKHLITNNNGHLLQYFILKDKKCKFHNFISNEYYCYSCKKNICTECLRNMHIGHVIIKFSSDKNKLKNILKLKIQTEENYNKIETKQCNKLIIKINQKLREINEMEKTIENIKKNIIKTYETNSMNYNNIKTLNLINRDFYNKKNIKYYINILNIIFENDSDRNISHISNNKSFENKSHSFFNLKILENNYNDSPIKLVNKNYNKNIILIPNNSRKPIFNVLNTNYNNNSVSNSEKLDKKNNIIIKKEEQFIENNNNSDIEKEFKYSSILDKKKRDYKMISSSFTLENNINNNLINNKINLINNINDSTQVDNNNNKISEKTINKSNDINKSYKIIETNNNIKEFFCIPHNIIILSFDNINNSSPSLNKLIYDKGEYIKLKHLKYINIFKEPINDINSYQDGSLLICTNKCIAKIKINNYDNGDYSIIFNHILNNFNDLENKTFFNKFNLKLCLPLSNENFLTCSQMNDILYWIKEKKSEKLQECNCELKNINIKGVNLNSIKEITDDLVVVNMNSFINGKISYNLLFLKIDKDNIIKVIENKIMMIKLNTSKNSIQKIDDHYFSALLDNGFIIIDTAKREICKKYIDDYSIFLFFETKLYGEYLYHFVLERKITNNKLIFKSYKSEISDIYNDKIKFESGQDLFLNFKNDFNKIYLLNELKLSEIGKNNNNIKVIMVFGNNIIIIFNYYS